MDRDDIEHKVVAALCQLDEYPGGWSDKRCTREVKNAVGAVGDRLGFKVHAASCRYDDIGEWLYDLCWCRQDEYGLVLDMPLALECEWQSGLTDVLDDFQKLLVSRVEIRYGKVLEHPVFKAELLRHPLLKKLGVIAMPRGKNPFRVLDKEWQALKELSTELREIGRVVAGSVPRSQQ